MRPTKTKKLIELLPGDVIFCAITKRGFDQNAKKWVIPADPYGSANGGAIKGAQIGTILHVVEHIPALQASLSHEVPAHGERQEKSLRDCVNHS